MNQTHRFLYSLAGLFMLSGLVFSTSVVAEDIEGAYAPGSITVDGRQTDWEGINTTYFKDEGVVVGLANDTANLYILFRFNNAEYVRTIHQTGLTLYLDAKGKKKKDIAVRYYGGPKSQMPNDPRMEQLTDRQRERMEQRLERRMGQQSDKFQFVDKKNVLDVVIEPSGANGPAVAFDTLQGFYQYEFCIPLHQSAVRNYGMGAEPGNKISIGIEWGNSEYSNRPEGERPEGGPGGGMGGGMGGGPPGGGMGGGPPGGGMGGGPPGGMRGGRNEIEKQDIWIKTTLATPPSPEEK